LSGGCICVLRMCVWCTCLLRACLPACLPACLRGHLLQTEACQLSRTALLAAPWFVLHCII
jgi:hypothetical protein